MPADRRLAAAAIAARIPALNRRCASSATAVNSATRLAKWRNGAPGDTPARRAASRTLTVSTPPCSTSSSAASINTRLRSPWW